jgi:hypothetical protein
MEYVFSLTLERPTSQIAFGEEQTIITITVVNAERIAALTEGKVYVQGRELSYSAGFSDTSYAARGAIREAGEQKAIAQKSKEVTVDFEAVQEKVIAAYQHDKTRDEKAALERKQRDEQDEVVRKHVEDLKVPDVILWTGWSAVEIRYQGHTVKTFSYPEFLAVTQADVYGAVLAYLNGELEAEQRKREQWKEEAEQNKELARFILDKNLAGEFYSWRSTSKQEEYEPPEQKFEKEFGLDC